MNSEQSFTLLQVKLHTRKDVKNEEWLVVLVGDTFWIIWFCNFDYVKKLSLCVFIWIPFIHTQMNDFDVLLKDKNW